MTKCLTSEEAAPWFAAGLLPCVFQFLLLNSWAPSCLSWPFLFRALWLLLDKRKSLTILVVVFLFRTQVRLVAVVSCWLTSNIDVPTRVKVLGLWTKSTILVLFDGAVLGLEFREARDLCVFQWLIIAFPFHFESQFVEFHLLLLQLRTRFYMFLPSRFNLQLQLVSLLAQLVFLVLQKLEILCTLNHHCLESFVFLYDLLIVQGSVIHDLS